MNKKPGKYKYYNFNLQKRTCIRKFALFSVNFKSLSVKFVLFKI